MRKVVERQFINLVAEKGGFLDLRVEVVERRTFTKSEEVIECVFKEAERERFSQVNCL